MSRGPHDGHFYDHGYPGVGALETSRKVLTTVLKPGIVGMEVVEGERPPPEKGKLRMSKHLPTVDFSRSGAVDAAHAAYVGEPTSGGVPVWIRHPAGGSVLVTFESTLGFAEDLVAGLNSVLGAWAHLSLDES